MSEAYLVWEIKGRIMQKWIENKQKLRCPYFVSTFTLTSRHQDYIVNRASVKLDAKLLTALHMNNANSTYRKISITQRDEAPPVWWIGRTGPGVIFIDNIFRSKRSGDPYMSEFTKAAYEMDFPLDSLKYVFGTNVNEKDTLSCVRKVYKTREGLRYPSSTEQIWEPSSPEFQALLGVGIGKVVAGSVLCAWGQERKRIARIVTFHIGADVHKLHMRFDLEDM
ncbi:hypothetical protein N7491_007011 [Penicillium cf. griseofulvum]|uniref:Uncharacterized protein n=1 Tax=Penicillium cf. griseofulvum TaxID=2972120 RepID=A0A9W9IVW7_9EURO|nr:hypothetical protein N7472_009957 [Penicillium cf. griseofulvum]KAJ5429995.1 hypothetical protein N7491_007011 [Penicillium cf. griseofulvum]